MKNEISEKKTIWWFVSIDSVENSRDANGSSYIASFLNLKYNHKNKIKIEFVNTNPYKTSHCRNKTSFASTASTNLETQIQSLLFNLTN